MKNESSEKSVAEKSSSENLPFVIFFSRTMYQLVFGKIKDCLIVLIEKLNMCRDKNPDKLRSNFSPRKKICRKVCTRKKRYGVQCRRTLYITSALNIYYIRVHRLKRRCEFISRVLCSEKIRYRVSPTAFRRPSSLRRKYLNFSSFTMKSKKVKKQRDIPYHKVAMKVQCMCAKK